MTLPNTDYVARAKAVFPGGALGSFTLPEGQEFVATRGEGARLYDTAGKAYVDYVLSSGPMILGHAHPAVSAAVHRQVDRGSTFYTTNDVAVRLAEKILEATGWAEMLKFCSSGSEATFYALRLARAATGRDKILKFEGAYHGHNDYAMLSYTPAGDSFSERPLPDTAGIPQATQEQVLVAPYNDLAVTAALLEQHANEVAAVIVEPGCRLIDPAPGFLQGLRTLCSKLGILLVYDEVVTGFRVAWGGATQLYGVTPDLVAYGKIVGGGYPLAAVAGKRAVLGLSNPRAKGPGYTYISGTLNGNPLAAAAGLATLEELEKPGVYHKLNALGARLRSGLLAAAAKTGLPAQVLGVGPMANIYFTSRPIRDYREAQTEDRGLKQKLQRALLDGGHLTNPWAKLYLSTAHSEADVDATIAAAKDTLARG